MYRAQQLHTVTYTDLTTNDSIGFVDLVSIRVVARTVWLEDSILFHSESSFRFNIITQNNRVNNQLANEKKK